MGNILPVANNQTSAGVFKEILRTMRSCDLAKRQAGAARIALYQVTNLQDPRIQRHCLEQLLFRIKTMHATLS